MTRIHTFDPGVTTGYALWNTATKQFEAAAEIKHIEEFARLGRSAAVTEDFKDDIFVAEQFFLYPGAARKLIWNSMPAAVTMGYVELIASMAGCRLYKQKAADMHRIPDKILFERGGVKQLPHSEHIKDAMRHALYFYFNTWPKIQAKHTQG